MKFHYKNISILNFINNFFIIYVIWKKIKRKLKLKNIFIKHILVYVI